MCAWYCVCMCCTQHTKCHNISKMYIYMWFCVCANWGSLSRRCVGKHYIGPVGRPTGLIDPDRSIDPVGRHYIGPVSHEPRSWPWQTHETGIFLKTGTNPYCCWPYPTHEAGNFLENRQTGSLSAG